jgi:hypothetical protein
VPLRRGRFFVGKGKRSDEGKPLRDGSEALKLLSLFAASAVVVFAVWLTLERGGHISGLGKAQQEDAGQVPAARLADPPPPPPAQQVRTYPPKEVNPPAQRSQREAATMYKWVDEKGTIHFSDQPRQQGAEKITVAEVASYNNQVAQPVYRQVSTDNVTERRTITVAQVNRPVQAERIGRGRFRTSEGHVISAFDKHLGNLLSFEGRVEGGSRCSALILRGCLTSKSGSRRCFDAVASDVGGSGGRLFESPADEVKRLKEGWEVTSITAYCQ